MPATRRRGSVLIGLSLVLVAFVAASVMVASAQIGHARRLGADEGRLRALYAAEAGVHAAYVAGAAVAPTALTPGAEPEVAYEATISPEAAASRIVAVGTVRAGADTYRVTAEALVLGGRLTTWKYAP